MSEDGSPGTNMMTSVVVVCFLSPPGTSPGDKTVCVFINHQ